jgi:hypothetical protein
VHQGGGRGHRTEYYARLPIDVHDQVVNAPARARALRRAQTPRPPVDQVDAASDGGLQAPAAAAAVAEPAADQLAGGAQAHDDVAGADHGLVVGKVPGEASAAAAVTSADGAETVAHRQRGGEGGSHTPSRSPGNPGGHQAGTGGARHAPRPTRPARVPAPVAAVISAIPATERQRLWIRTWRPPAPLATARAALALARAAVAAATCPLHPEGCPASAQVSVLWGTVSRQGDVAAPPAPGGPEWQQAWAVLLGDQAVTVGADGYLRPA